MAQIIWNKRASKQLAALQKYLQEEFGEKTAQICTVRIFEFLELLLKYPQIGSVENTEKGVRGFLLHRHTTILYKQKQENIYILAVFDNWQHPDKKNI
ncbi:type II toxin-antitoxin system RelE/ParE family toxin [Pontibacter sp. E15-1]|uniref:type II toxin-antitoxin system RelE/ParE family toxin n=1 Tax=Pontibacter sp. E15-1 TaxID=2919918 RepID=UPI001F4FFB23|nr:type II toxin-antitoxin system RelE/ParE family toxin [Pontibacter sp. E15-1]MCJ8164976.1 type II toxin-antitoxin system RelE/ParE family toxin [Pontibacter sp. E15-1]